MNQFFAGFSRVNITPMLGIGMRGYFEARQAESVLDELEINALAVKCGNTTAVMMTIDVCAIDLKTSDAFRTHISEVTGIPVEAIYLHTTHTHTGPFLEKDSEKPLVPEYYEFVYRRFADAAVMAIQDLKPARMGWSVTQAPGIAFVRRYLMKDGSWQTNPGRLNPDVVAPIGEPDHRLSLLRFDREGGDTLYLANFGNHPDTISGKKISADWPGHFRRELERILPGCKALLFNGAQGDLNHINIAMGPKEFNVGYAFSKHLGRFLAGTALQVVDKMKYVEVDSVRFLQKNVPVQTNVPEPEEIPQAQQVMELFRAGRLSDLNAKDWRKPMNVAMANRILMVKDWPAVQSVPMSGIAIGPVAFVGIPGEPFCAVGKAIKDTEGWDLILPTCLTNGGIGYFPTLDAFEGSGYERSASRFLPGTAERLIDNGKQLLREL